ncbi:damage-control phosphatase ARMT1 family protein [Methanocaldococcus indicus]|uniref:damage-control phosphatase ARMT1 family protein n=1 Tax=Methanocaldococcus indicus TaxID=213231 RepID=UPI003C6CCA20
MYIKPECAICIVRQVVDAVKEITDNEDEQFKLVNNCFDVIKKYYHKNIIPAEMGTRVHRYLKEISGCEDPYKRLKEIANKIALKYYDIVKEECNLEDSYLRLRKIILSTIAGNVIDYGAYSTDVDIENLIFKTLNEDLKIDYTRDLLEDLKNDKIKKILYICDNAGEIVFDKLLMEEFKKYNKEVVVVVKGKPILNDATLEDAKVAKIDEVAKIITTGSDVIGILLEECSEEFKKHLNDSDIIIAKGMGNYESLPEYKINKKVYFILKAKCKPVANNLGVNVGDNVILKKYL